MHTTRTWPVALVSTLAVALLTSLTPAQAQTPTPQDEQARTDRMRSLVGMTPFVNYVPLPSSSLGADKSATWFLDPNSNRVVHCAGNPTTGIRCTSAVIPTH